MGEILYILLEPGVEISDISGLAEPTQEAYDQSQLIVRTYYSSVQPEKKEETEKMIKNGTARIVICTDAMSLGVDIRDILRIPQWGIRPSISLSG